jgi:type IV/VI secretion system ImpK/VasF family protein
VAALLRKQPKAAPAAGPARAAREEVTPRLADHAGSLLSLILLLRRSTDLDQFRDLRLTIERLIAEFRAKARDDGASGTDVDDATYALAATIDEILLNARWNGRDAWERDTLARTWCHDEFVGIGFYDKLNQIRRGGTARPQALEVFYYCLVAGFQGKLVEDPAQWNKLVEDLAPEIAPPVKILSPEGQLTEKETAASRLASFPWPAILITAIFLPLLVLLLAYGTVDRNRDAILKALAGH